MSGFTKHASVSLSNQSNGKLAGAIGADGKEYFYPLIFTSNPAENYQDSSATPGAATANVPRGRISVAAAATSVVVTNNLVTATSYIGTNIATADATAVIKSVVPGAGSFTINLTGPTAQTNIDFIILG